MLYAKKRKSAKKPAGKRIKKRSKSAEKKRAKKRRKTVRGRKSKRPPKKNISGKAITRKALRSPRQRKTGRLRGKTARKTKQTLSKGAGPAKRNLPLSIIDRAVSFFAGEEAYLGKVTHYFPKVRAGAIKIEKGNLASGDVIHIKGHTTDFKQKITSIEIDRVSIHQGQPGDEVGTLVRRRIRTGDTVYKVKR